MSTRLTELFVQEMVVNSHRCSAFIGCKTILDKPSKKSPHWNLKWRPGTQTWLSSLIMCVRVLMGSTVIPTQTYSVRKLCPFHSSREEGR